MWTSKTSQGQSSNKTQSEWFEDIKNNFGWEGVKGHPKKGQKSLCQKSSEMSQNKGRK